MGVGVACIGVDMVLVCMSFDGEANDEGGGGYIALSLVTRSKVYCGGGERINDIGLP